MTSADDSPVPSYGDKLRLDGKGIILVGAGQGIGRQTAHALSQAGARVFCIDNQEDLAKEVADEVDGFPWVADARSRTDVEQAVTAAASALGTIDGLVDIVGMAKYADLVDITEEEYDWAFDMSLKHAVLFSQFAGRSMRSGGAMVFVASVSGLLSAPRHAAYGAAKAALMSWVRTLAVELGPRGVRANAVAPGFVWTPRVSQIVGEKGREHQAKLSPLNDVAMPSDIASAILFLSSDLSRYVTGQTLVVDGGVNIRFPYGTP